MRMAGSSTVAAPSSRRRASSDEDWARARVTTIVRPNRGRRSNQPRSRPATAPTTMVAGDCRSWSARVPSVARTVRWSGRVPQITAAAGVSGSRPPSMSRWVIARMRPTPMRTTIVPPTRATASQSTEPSSGTEGSSWPVTTVKLVEENRWVTGMPA
jgi:hypothetical protein